MEKFELYSTMSMIVLAGSETSATLLSGLVFRLLKNPEIYGKLTKEVRSAFNDTSDMAPRNEADFPYLNACIEEALRIYPPVPMSIPHITPPEGATVSGRFIPGNVLVHPRHLIAKESC
jgi:cytochrome P450